MRGERKARWLLARIGESQLSFSTGRDKHGPTLKFIDTGERSDEQRAVIKDAVMFAIAFPGCFRTAVKIAEAEGLTAQSEAA